MDRFGKFVEIQFDQRRRISRATIRTYFPERSCVCQVPSPEKLSSLLHALWCISGECSKVQIGKSRKFPLSESIQSLWAGRLTATKDLCHLIFPSLKSEPKAYMHAVAMAPGHSHLEDKNIRKILVPNETSNVHDGTKISDRIGTSSGQVERMPELVTLSTDLHSGWQCLGSL